jgi:transposase
VAPPLRPTSCTRTRGKKSTPHRDSSDPPRRRANKRQEHGTYDNDRPPIISVISRDTGEQRWWVCDRADRRTGAALIAENLPPSGTLLCTDEWQSYRRSHPAHATVRHGVHAWVRDDDGGGRREVHCKPARARAQRSEPTCVPFGAFISSTCISMWQQMKRWSIRNGSHLISSDGCASVTCQRTLATHEPNDLV